MQEILPDLLSERKKIQDENIWDRYRVAPVKSIEKRMIQQEIIEKYQYLVKFVIRRMNLCPPRELDYEDLISYGNMGLLDAMEKYDPFLGYAFQTYAASRIRGTILDELRRFDWISRTGREKLFALEKAREQELQESGVISSKRLRARLGMTEDQLREVMDISSRSQMSFLDEELYLDDSSVEKSGLLAGDFPCPAEVTEDKDEMEKLHEAIKDLTSREKQLIYLYYFKYYNFRDIAEEFNLSESRISQLHKKVLDKLKNRLSEILKIVNY